jgi:hypothetical protein
VGPWHDGVRAHGAGGGGGAGDCGGGAARRLAWRTKASNWDPTTALTTPSSHPSATACVFLYASSVPASYPAAIPRAASPTPPPTAPPPAGGRYLRPAGTSKSTSWSAAAGSTPRNSPRSASARSPTVAKTYRPLSPAEAAAAPKASAPAAEGRKRRNCGRAPVAGGTLREREGNALVAGGAVSRCCGLRAAPAAALCSAPLCSAGRGGREMARLQIAVIFSSSLC